MTRICSKQMELYFKSIEKSVESAYKIANEARSKGFDPEDKVDVVLALTMADRVEGLMMVVAPQLVGQGMPKRITELEKKYGALSWRVALLIAAEIAEEKFCKFKDKKEAIEVGIRAGFAYHTVGIVAAPLEGLTEIKIKKRRDGKEYLALMFAGPVRGAGGTAASVCVVIADYVRKRLGLEKYDPDEKEQNRYVIELQDYHERVTNLQYNPSKEEILFLVKNLPVEVDGDPTENREVSNYKDLPRIETNRIRSGVCLVTSMIALKAPKLWKRLGKWGDDFDIDWNFLEEFLILQKKKKSESESANEGDEGDSTKEKPKLTPNYTFIADLVAGRPVFAYPMRPGGFRLRYGRSRLSGYSAAAVHPATMFLLNSFIATGAQLKVERPGKAAAMTPCDTIEGPIVRLENGNVMRLETVAETKQLMDDVEEVLFIGDILFNYGDFSENGHKLVPSGYCEEWWTLELEKAVINNFGTLDLEKLSEMSSVKVTELKKIFDDPVNHKISGTDSLNISNALRIPLHPRYTFHWNLIKKEEFITFYKWMTKANVKKDENIVRKLILPLRDKEKKILESLGIVHSVVMNEFIVFNKDVSAVLNTLLVEKHNLELLEKFDSDVLNFLNNINSIKQRDKSGTFIGARMGRPEKAKMRKLLGSPHGLFPVGKEGGRLRCFQSSLEKGNIRTLCANFYCKKCEKEIAYRTCKDCGKKATLTKSCRICGPVEDCEHNPQTFSEKTINIREYFDSAFKILETRACPDLIKGVRGMSNKDRVPEHLVKAILRAKYDVFVNKDGTVRYDMIETPITHFKPIEIGTPVEKLRELGYLKDAKGNELVNENQVVEIKPQDIIIAGCSEMLDEPASDVLMRTADFIDELLIKLYKQKPFFNIKTKADLVGQLVIGLAPHISAGMIARIIGFSNTQGFFAHPLMHAAMRRDCDGDEACIFLLMDALLNFSRNFLPDKRGGRTMDAPLVLTPTIIPAEVDDMVLGLDVVWRYPLAFYEAAMAYKNPWDVDVEQLGKRIDTEGQYERMGFTHNTSNMNAGVNVSAYKILPSMKEKMEGQMQVAEKVRAVDESDVARLIIDKHFLKDTKGNLRKFSQQQFRCVGCNEKFRRLPLRGICSKCNGKIIFTISQGSVIKYFEPSWNLAMKYNVPPYLKQTLELTKLRIDSYFGVEKEKQIGLNQFF